MVRKPASLHRPEFAEFVGAASVDNGRVRFVFQIPSKSGEPYNYLVNPDGTRPYCECRDRHAGYSHGSCYLCTDEGARAMAERGRLAAAGEPAPIGF